VIPAQLARLRQITAGVAHDLRGGFAMAGDTRSFLRFASDVLLSRLIRVAPLASQNHLRRIRVRGDVLLQYRLNRGDMQSIREVWIDERYRLPFDLVPERLVDLGAHIGLTSLWFVTRCGCKEVIAVEPLPANAHLVRLNLESNKADFALRRPARLTVPRGLPAIVVSHHIQSYAVGDRS